VAESRVPPHDLTAEDAVVGSLMLTSGHSNDVAEKVFHLIGPSDFYRPANGHIFHSCHQLWLAGEPIDAVTIADKLKADGLLDQCGGAAHLISMMSNTPAVSAAPKYAKIIADLSTLRRVLAVSAELMDAALNRTMDTPGELIQSAISDLSALDISLDSLPEGVSTLDDFLDRPDIERPPWCIPGLMRVGWRCILVAAEGVGKTTLFRQIGMAAAQGIHPLAYTKIKPVRTLIVDLENPDDSILDTCEPIRATVRSKVTDYDPDRAWLWHKPSGIDIRSRADRGHLEAVIAHCRPQLVCLGPLYKAYSVSAKESDEQAAGEVMRILDSLRTRYQFGLMMEHHAPKAHGGSTRAMMPYGSSLWLRWPELGLSMTPEDNEGNLMKVGRWRGDRLKSQWPTQLSRSSPWPWQGRWPTGTFGGPNEPPPPTVINEPTGLDEPF